jgi:hypothetical protein
MQMHSVPFYYSVNAQGLIQATPATGHPQNIMIPSGSSSAGQATPGMPPLQYAGIYTGKVN